MDATTIGFVALAAVILLVIARGVYQLILGVSMTEALITHDNKAAAIALAGFLLGVIQVIIPVFSGPAHSFWTDLANVAAYGLIGIVVLTISGLIFTGYCKVTGTDLKGQIAQGNVAAGITAAGAYLGVSSLTSGILTGDGGALLPTFIFWAAGLLALIVLTHLFRLLTAYDDAALISHGNIAAALGFAGLIIAVGMMVGYSVAGTFTGYKEGFISFGLFLLLTLLFYPVRQILVQMLLLGGGFRLYNGRLDHEIAEDHNIGAGVLEAFGYIATALLLTRI
jgi:putative membrane protein